MQSVYAAFLSGAPAGSTRGGALGGGSILEIVRDTPFEVALQVWQARPPTPSLTVVVKATLELAGGAYVIASEQAPVTGDAFHDDEPLGSLRYPSDLAWLKPRGECLLVGDYVSPTGPTTAVPVVFRVGKVKKELVLLGDRHFKGGLFGGVSDPRPFEAMPLCWERSFGGAAIADNPVGRGVDPVAIDGKELVPLPNIEDRRSLVSSKKDRPKPAGAFPLHPSWKARARHLGTFDRGWQKSRFPHFPADLHPEYFCAAPEDQRIDGFFRGDERVELENLVPGAPLVSAALPGLRARCFLAQASGGALRELPLSLDTVIAQAPEGKLYLLFRGVTEVADAELTEFTHLFVAHEALDAAAPPEAYEARLRARLDDATAEDRELEGITPPGDSDAPLPSTPASEAAAFRAAVIEARAAGRSLAGAMLPAADLSGLDLREADFRGAVLRGASLAGADLTGAAFDEAVLIGASFEGAVLVETSFRAADLGGARAKGARLERVALDEAQAVGADFEGASFVRCHAVDAELAGANLGGATLEGCLFDHADLSGAKLEGAKLAGCSLVDASLENGAQAASSTFEDCDLGKLRASDGSDFTGAVFRRTKLEGARFPHARLDGADLSFAEIAGADFSDASLEGALLLGSNLRGARFDRAKLGGAQLVRADLMQARFEDAELSRADLRGSNLYGAELFGAKTEGALLELANLEGTKLA
jgi:uncharacterized protein YjbI with pentapeptide repeats